MTNDVFDKFVALAARWDLVELKRELSQALDGLDESQRPYVPTHLSDALGMFLDSYGPPDIRWSERS